MRNDRKAPLYRKEKKTGLSTHYYTTRGAQARWSRHSKAAQADTAAEVTHQSIKKGQYGYDYTPLYRFLLSKVGQPWSEVYSEAKSRLDKEDPIFLMVVLHPAENELPSRRLGHSAYFSTLTVNDAGILIQLDPNYTLTETFCSCCTHTWNGQPVAG